MVCLCGYKDKLLLYREKAEIQETVAQRITKEVIDEVKKEEDEHVTMLLNNLGFAWNDLGEYQKAIEFYNKALAIFLDFFEPDHPSTKTVAGNIEYLQQ